MRHRHRSPAKGSLLRLALANRLQSRAQWQASGKAVTQSALVRGCRALSRTLKRAKSEQHANFKNGHYSQSKTTLYTRGSPEGRQGRSRSAFGRLGPRLVPGAGTQRPVRGQFRKSEKHPILAPFPSCSPEMSQVQKVRKRIVSGPFGPGPFRAAALKGG